MPCILMQTYSPQAAEYNMRFVPRVFAYGPEALFDIRQRSHPQDLFRILGHIPASCCCTAHPPSPSSSSHNTLVHYYPLYVPGSMLPAHVIYIYSTTIQFRYNAKSARPSALMCIRRACVRRNFIPNSLETWTKFSLKLIFNRSIMAPAAGVTNFPRRAAEGAGLAGA